MTYELFGHLTVIALAVIGGLCIFAASIEAGKERHRCPSCGRVHGVPDKDES